jgi:histidinol-phosphate aminotransferase
MSRFDDIVPPYIRALGGYAPGKPVRLAESESGVACIKLASNENPLGPSPRAVEAIRAASQSSNFYPDNDNTELRARLASQFKIDAAQILVTNGTTAFIDITARTLLSPGLNAITSERTFIVYPLLTRAAGGTLIEVPMRDDAFDLDAVAAAIDRDTRIVFIANPNNPTGTMLDAATVDRFVDRVPDHVLVVLDEAYCDFAQDFAARAGIRYSNSLDYVRQGRNVIVLRTFSKAHGLAGLRVGYGFAAPAILQYFARVRTAFSVSGVAEAAALAALDDTEHVRRSIENNAVGAAWLIARLREMGLRTVPTSASFVYFEVPEAAAAVAKRVQAEGVIVRPLTAWGVPNGIRVTVGTPEQNQKFVSVLKKALERVPAL